MHGKRHIQAALFNLSIAQTIDTCWMWSLKYKGSVVLVGFYIVNNDIDKGKSGQKMKE